MKSWSLTHIIGVLAAFAFGTFIGFAGGTQIARNRAIQEQDLPVASSLLTSPVLYEWWGSFEGTLKEKTEGSVILEKDGQKMEIQVPPQTFFTKKTGAKPTDVTLLTLAQVEPGSRIRGIALVRKKGSLRPEQKEDAMVGNSFSIEESIVSK